MRLVDFYPTKGTFKPHEKVALNVVIESEEERSVNLNLSVYHLIDCTHTQIQRIQLKAGLQDFQIEIQFSSKSPHGYGVEANLFGEYGDPVDSISSSFDVLDFWTDFPRYGFLCDFNHNRSDIAETIESLVRYHINGIQFYDWQYRHDRLVSPTRQYIDPMGRNLSLDTIEELISATHNTGMAAMPYLAVYAASPEFWLEHKDWALYDECGNPIKFDDFLGLMDPTSGSPWIKHLLGQCSFVLDNLPFDGLHVDQYGDPKEGFNFRGECVDIPNAFHEFIQSLKRYFPTADVVFNAVRNWPIDALATAPLDFIYIEVWPPDTTYADLLNIVSHARYVSGGKPVVIAIYLPSEQQANIRLTDALLYASGATRIEIGEHERLLVDPYFPKHEQIASALRKTLRSYYDFVVRYSDILGPTADDVSDLYFEVPDSVWVIPRVQSGWIAVNLINFRGVDDLRWDKPHNRPISLHDFTLQITGLNDVLQIWWASPDHSNPRMLPVDWEVEDGVLHLILPILDYWNVLVIKTGEKIYND
jgi:dextranase